MLFCVFFFFIRSVLQDIVNRSSDGIIGCYEKLLPTGKSGETSLPFTQQRALQALFDVRFLLQIIPRKDDDKVMNYTLIKLYP